MPSPKQRLEILQSLIGEMEQSLSYEQVQHLAIATHGFVGADLAALCNEAAFNCLRRYVKSKYSDDCLHQTSIADEDCSNGLNVPCFSKDTTDISMDYSDSRSSSVSHLGFSLEASLHLKGTNGDGDKFLNDIEGECVLKVTFEDFEKARIRVRPSAMREVSLILPCFQAVIYV